MPNGSKLWRFDFTFEGTRRSMSFGSYPAVSLTRAREKQQAARVLIEEGSDPVRERRSEAVRIERGTETFKDLTRDIHHIPTNSVTAADILPVLKRLEKMDKVESAIRLRGVIGSVFRFGIPRQRADADPTYSLRGAMRSIKIGSHAAITDEEAFGGLLRAIWGCQGWVTLVAGLKILAFCYPRPVELRKCEGTHVDLERRVSTVPEHLAKMRRQHDTPLSNQATAILKSRRRSATAVHTRTSPSAPTSGFYPKTRSIQPCEQRSIQTVILSHTACDPVRAPCFESTSSTATESRSPWLTSGLTKAAVLMTGTNLGTSASR